MTTKNLTNLLSVWALLSVALFTNCTAEDNNQVDNQIISSAEVPFMLSVKALDTDSHDITSDGDVTSATLFIFNDQNDFVKKINVDKSTLLQGRNIEIQCDHTKSIKVVAWAGLSTSSTTVSNLNEANIITDLQVQLNQNDGIATAPGDLFYGQTTVYRNTTKATSQTLSIQRKASSISLNTNGLVKYLGSTKGNFVYKIKKTKSAFNYNGELTGNDVEYAIPASFNQYGELTSAKTSILPASRLTIELYRDNELIFSIEKDKNDVSLAATQGKQMTYEIDYSKKISVNVSVTDWNTVNQTVVIN